MALDRSRLRRIARAKPKKRLTRSPSPAELMLDRHGRPRPWVLAADARYAARRAAAAEARNAGPPPEPTEATARPAEATPADPQPPAPQTPPPEPQWWEEKCRWRSREEAEPYDDGVRYETIHEYDPLEWASEEEDYDLDN